MHRSRQGNRMVKNPHASAIDFISNCEGAMRPLLLASVSIAALFIASEANAADLAVKAPRPMMVPAPVYSWTGCYVGAQVGWGWGHNQHHQPALVGGSGSGGSIRDFGGKVNSSGGLFGGQVGCNYQFASNWVIGAQGDIAGTDFNGRNDDPLALFFGTGNGTIAIKSDWLASATMRLGYTFYDNRAMFYVKGGGAWIHNIWDLHDAFAFYSPTILGETRSGWTAGAGFEYMLTQNWTAFVEGNYYNFGNGKLLEISPSDPAAFYSGKQTVETVKIGVNYKFGGDAPVVAKY
ncbi:MAG: porin family protein [Bradyrhizobium sp.]|uniref:outer membrane protein n=1 Tax=Bradyrhizobium sp. TaxID=376 RepID=UPI0012201953|nr:outer membrane beta-barrel protein [Bradyrhizobium sp.]THD70668.1 MAG: porin family protein [Bradyrhizobium sp.]